MGCTPRDDHQAKRTHDADPDRDQRTAKGECDAEAIQSRPTRDEATSGDAILPSPAGDGDRHSGSGARRGD